MGNLSAGDSARKLGREKNEEWRGFLSLIRSEKFARQVKEWTTEVFLNICVHSTRYKRVQSLDRLSLGKQLPGGSKDHAKAKTRHFPVLLRVNFASILSNIEVVNVCVSSKYINQPLAKSTLILCNKILQNEWQL